MDRTSFFRLAQRAAVHTRGFKDFSKPVAEECIVVYNEIRYYPQYVKVGYNEYGGVVNIAVLHDVIANSTTECELRKVSEWIRPR